MNITLTSSTTEILMGNVTSLFSDFSGVFSLILGIILALFIISKLLSMFTGDSNSGSLSSSDDNI